jgi:hypothetical protein
VIRCARTIFDSGVDVSAAIRIRQDFDAATLRRLATTVKGANQARRLLAMAAIYDGKDREEAPGRGTPSRTRRRLRALKKGFPARVF